MITKSTDSGPVRVRFAFSLTGDLHVESVRTALFNYLFARHAGGDYILRIEETDGQQSDPKLERLIIDSLHWLGLSWDEGPDIGGDFGPYRQSERQAIYREKIQILLSSGRAYRCFCTPEACAERRQMNGSDPSRYDGHCRLVAVSDSDHRASAGEPFVVRLKTPPEMVTVPDLIKEDVVFSEDQFDDFVLIHPGGIPDHVFSCVVDDLHMRISHVIRSEDHIHDTPKQIQIYQALGEPVPLFAHVPHILGPDGPRLSWRDDEVSVGKFKEAGYLPQALVNYLELLYCSHPEGNEKVSISDMIEMFSLDRMSKSAVCFDYGKLKWLNGLYLREQSVAKIATEIEKRTRTWEEESKQYTGILTAFRERPEIVNRMVRLFMPDSATIEELRQKMTDFFITSIANDPQSAVVEKAATAIEPAAARVVKEFLGRLQIARPYFQSGEIGPMLEEVRAEFGVGKQAVYLPLRMALTGVQDGPQIRGVLAVMGPDRILARGKHFLSLIESIVD